MKKAVYQITLFLISIVLILFNSCMEDKMKPVTAFDKSGNGVFISCEGNFMYGNASLSYYNKESGKIDNEVFLKANGIPLGDVAQDVLISEDNLWISINNSGKIYAINPDDFTYKGKIKGLTSPRYMLPVNNTELWVSDLYSGKINIIDKNSFSLKGSVDLNKNNNNKHNAEQMIIYNDQVICNSWSEDKYLFFIDKNSKKVTDSLEVGIQPKKICLDNNNMLWVLCDGGYSGASIGHEAASLFCIDPSKKTIEKKIVFNEDKNPVTIALNNNGEFIYLINSSVYLINADTKKMEKIIPENGHNFYAISEDPENSDIYVSDAGNYMEKGTVLIYNHNYKLTDSIKTGIIPSGFAFN